MYSLHLLAAHMKFGATTVHWAFGIPIGSIDASRPGYAFFERLARVKAAFLYILDEMSMLSRMMLGKISYRVEEALGLANGSLGGRDCVLAGDLRQIPPVEGNPLYKAVSYTHLTLPTNREV